MRLVPGLCVSFLLLLLAAPYSLSAQDGTISATITPDDSMFVYGGMVFTLLVRNNSEDTILFLDTMSDMYVRLDNGRGRVYTSKRTWKPIADTIPIAPGNSFRTRFELTTLGVSATVTDNFGWGPFFEPDTYQMSDTLQYIFVGNREKVYSYVNSRALQIYESSHADWQGLQVSRAAQIRMLGYFYGMEFAGYSSSSLYRVGLQDYAAFADTCPNLRFRRRFIQAYIEIAVEQILLAGMDYFAPDDADAFRVDNKKRLENYIVTYPDMPFSRFCAMHLRLRDPEPAYIESLAHKGVSRRLISILRNKNVKYTEYDFLR